MAMIGGSSGFETHAQTAQQLLLISVAPGTNMNAVAQAYQGKVLGSVGPNTYLVQAGTLTPSTFVSGILSVEPDSAVNPPVLKGGIITAPAGMHLRGIPVSRRSPEWELVQDMSPRARGSSLPILTRRSIIRIRH